MIHIKVNYKKSSVKKISKICTLKQALQIMKLVEKVRQNRKQ